MYVCVWVSLRDVCCKNIPTINCSDIDGGSKRPFWQIRRAKKNDCLKEDVPKTFTIFPSGYGVCVYDI